MIAHRRRTPLLPVITLLPTLCLAPSCGSDPTRATFSENVGSSFAQCNPAEVRFLAGKHNFMTAFDPCGSNHFAAYAWSPGGTHLYFQLTHTSHVMDAEAQDKRTITVPTETPIGPAAWASDTRLVVPIGPGEEGGPIRFALFDREQLTLSYHPVPALTAPADLQASGSDVWFTAVGPRGRAIWHLDVDTDQVEPAFEWALPFAGRLTSFQYALEAGIVILGVGETVTLHQARDGEVLESYTPARRGTLHPDGRWLALEHQGDSVSVFYQRSWDELSERARAREVARAEQFADRLPDWYPKDVMPPTISMVDRTNGSRWLFTGFQGDRFSWYAARDFYVSLVLWGFEGKELNRNVVLGNLADRLKAIERGEEMLGVTRFSPSSVAPISGENTP